VGIRETINEKPAIAYGGFGVLLLIAIGLLFYFLRGGPGAAPIDKPVGDQVFYTVDDGQTWFPDALQKATPFKHDGKDAVRAMVYRCSDGKTFCAFLVRHTDLGRQQKGLMLEIANRPSFSEHPLTEVKKPGTKDWLPVDAKIINKVADVMSAPCSGNPNDVPQLIFPG
jgi:hypothetical protein